MLGTPRVLAWPSGPPWPRSPGPWRRARPRSGSGSPPSSATPAAGDEEQGHDAIGLVQRLALARRRGPQETLEFVARRLADGDGGIATNWNIGADFEHLRGHDFKVLLGTPIYLAYVD
jgi:hypothetical protein